jgi:anti-sigma B factor antagonist
VTKELAQLVVVRLSGDFDLLAVEPFNVEVERAAAMAEEAVVIDLRGLTFVDSSGLRAMLDGHSRIAARGVDVTFLKPPGRLMRVFEVTGADRLLPFDDARAAEVGPPPDGRDNP